MQVEYIVTVLRDTLDELGRGVAVAVPRLVTALVFFAVAYAVIRFLLSVVGSLLRGVYPADQHLVARLWVTVVGVFLWFGALLVLLNILGLGAVAASVGTGAGFLALGVSYALSEMIEDAVAGVYLLRDPDFNPVDLVTTQALTGTVRSIELRKSRFELDEGDVVVVANRDVEARWTKKAPDEGPPADGAAGATDSPGA
jgi:small-conductance mechanosensitive channel